MSHVYATNANASSFPDVEVEYTDLVGQPFRPNGRWGSGSIDCLGVVLEIYRRGGLGLPDPATAACSMLQFQALFEEVAAADQLFDVLELRRGEPHLMVVVRTGLALSAGRKLGTYTKRQSRMRGLSGLTFWRLKTSVYPV